MHQSCERRGGQGCLEGEEGAALSCSLVMVSPCNGAPISLSLALSLALSLSRSLSGGRLEGEEGSAVDGEVADAA